MSRNRLYRGLLIAGLAGAAVGVALYAADSPHRPFARWALWSGLAALAAWGALNRGALAAFSRGRAARRGADTFVAVAAFLSIVVVVQALSSRHRLRYDVTRDKRFTLAEQTLSVLDNLRRDVRAHAFFKRGTPDEARARDLFGQFRHRTARFDFEFVDPDQRPQRARQMDVYAFGTTVVEAGARRETIARLSEEALLNAIVKATRDTVRTLCFVKGHGERDPSNTARDGYSIAALALEREGFAVRSISLFDVASLPEECALAVVAGPRRDYLESEIAKIEGHLDRGGSALFLIDPQTDLPNVGGLLARYGIGMGDDAVVDPYSRVFGGDYSVPVVTEYENHPITRGFQLATFFPTARSVAITPEPAEGLTVQHLAKTGKSAWGEKNLDLIDKGQAVKDEGDTPGPVPLAAVARRKTPAPPGAAEAEDERNESAVVVFGDSDFAANGSFRMSGNSDLFLNVINYLAEEQEMIAIRSKTGLGDRLFLTASQGRLIFLVSVVLLPLAVIACGVTVWTRRRRRG